MGALQFFYFCLIEKFSFHGNLFGQTNESALPFIVIGMEGERCTTRSWEWTFSGIAIALVAPVDIEHDPTF
jgi:hypothetical protein